MSRTFGWDYPPGVNENMIPGNRQEDIDWENALERAMDQIEDLCINNHSRCEHAIFHLDIHDDEHFVACNLRIIKDNTFTVGDGDIGDCPYVQELTEELFQDIRQGWAEE